MLKSGFGQSSSRGRVAAEMMSSENILVHPDTDQTMSDQFSCTQSVAASADSHSRPTAASLTLSSCPTDGVLVQIHK